MSERKRITTTADVFMGGAGCVDVFAFDPARQLLAQENKKGETPFATFAYHYDANSNRDKITDNDGEHTYTCDSAVHPISIAKEKREAIIRKFKTMWYLSLYSLSLYSTVF